MAKHDSFAAEKSNSMTSQNAISDFHHDPSCDPCRKRGHNVKVFSYCTTCIEFLCKSCNDVHGHLAATSNHSILTDDRMPATEADKPPRYKSCLIHNNQLKKQFCNKHRKMICSKCRISYHTNCKISDITDMCNAIDSTELDEFTMSLANCKMKMISTRSNVENNIFELKEQKADALENVKELYNKTISKVNQVYADTLVRVNSIFEKLLKELQSQTSKLCQMISNLNSILENAATMKRRPIDSKLFLELQDMADRANQSGDNYNKLVASSFKLSMSFTPCSACKDFISSSFKLGSFKEHSSTYAPIGTVNTLIVPISESSSSMKVSTTVHSEKLTNTRKRIYSVKVKNDVDNCWIMGIAITKYGRRLMVDFNNKKVKMFTRDMEFLSSVNFLDWPWDVAVISDKEAVVCLEAKMLSILDISKRQLCVTATIKAPCFVKNLSAYNDKLVVTNQFSCPVSVKMIDVKGHLYWTSSLKQNADQRSQSNKWKDQAQYKIIVADRDSSTIHALNADTGETLSTCEVPGKEPQDVAIDLKGNVYVAFMNTSEIAVMSNDLSEYRILFSHKGLVKSKLLTHENRLSGEKPYALAYDETSCELLVSYVQSNKVDCYTLTEEIAGNAYEVVKL